MIVNEILHNKDIDSDESPCTNCTSSVSCELCIYR